MSNRSALPPLRFSQAGIHHAQLRRPSAGFGAHASAESRADAVALDVGE
jgi:hypothetical protein